MNEAIYKAQAELCSVFTHPTRIAILELLGEGERTVGEMAQASGVAQPTLSQHLAVLRTRGVVSTRKEGTSVHYSIADVRILEACHLMRTVLTERYRELGRSVEEAAAPQSSPAKRRKASKARS
jgi:ArsR family transcriptional regulator